MKVACGSADGVGVGWDGGGLPAVGAAAVVGASDGVDAGAAGDSVASGWQAGAKASRAARARAAVRVLILAGSVNWYILFLGVGWRVALWRRAAVFDTLRCRVQIGWGSVL